MKLTDLSKKQLVALSIQFKVFSSVTEAATRSVSDLVTALNKPEIIALVEETP